MLLAMTETERLILIHLLHLRAAQENSGDGDSLTRQIQILTYGFERHYDEVTQILRRPLAEADCQFVSDVIEMYRYIERARLDEADVAGHHLARFPGFDQRDEGPLRAYALFILDTPGDYAELQDHRRPTDNFNSHVAMSDRYRSMLAKFEERGGFGQPLTREEALAVLGE